MAWMQVLDALAFNALSASCLAALCWVVHRCARGTLAQRPAIAYAMWALVFARLALPPSPKGLVALPQWFATAQDSAAVLRAASSTVWTGPTDDNRDRFVEAPDLAHHETAQQPSSLLSRRPAISSAPALPSPKLLPSPRPSHRADFNWRRGAAALWILGTLGWTALTTRRTIRFRRALADMDKPPAWLGDVFLQIKRELNVRREVQLLVTSAQVGPLLWPGRMLSVVFPQSLLNRLSRDEVRTLLAHELWHVRRGDHLARRIELLLAAVYWWLPALWIARRELRAAEELCCDARVAAWRADLIGAYGRGLLAAAEATLKLPMSASGVTGNFALADRLTALYGPARRHRLAGPARVALAAGFAAIAGLVQVQAEPVSGGGPQWQTISLDRHPWLATPGPGVDSVRYQYRLGNQTRSVEAVREGFSGPWAMWSGVTWRSALHWAAHAPDEVDWATSQETIDPIERSRVAAWGISLPETTARLRMRPRAEGAIPVVIGNGVEGSWNGYFSFQSSECEIDFDPQSRLPVCERHGSTVIYLGDWRPMTDQGFAPCRVAVVRNGTAYLWDFALHQVAWMLHRGRVVGPQRDEVICELTDVVVNDAAQIAARRSEVAAKASRRDELGAMLDKNQAWLAPRETWQRLEYDFHTVREDVREACAVLKGQLAAFEVTYDG
ncbi:MAG: M56 family metallopeptidase, partial [Planctomycetales bacterium]|nr:M56 family metallopeptidase [Planctomycetales bacterium]